MNVKKELPHLPITDTITQQPDLNEAMLQQDQQGKSLMKYAHRNASIAKSSASTASSRTLLGTMVSARVNSNCSTALPTIHDAIIANLAESSSNEENRNVRKACKKKSFCNSKESNMNSVLRSSNIPIEPQQPAKKKKTSSVFPASFRHGSKQRKDQRRSSEAEELADWRDYEMFRRIVDRLTSQQKIYREDRWKKANAQCLAHVYDTRSGVADDDSDEDYSLLPPSDPRFPWVSGGTVTPDTEEDSLSTEDEEIFVLDI